MIRRRTWWMAAGIVLIAAMAAAALMRSREAQTAQRVQPTGAQVSGGTQILAPTVAVGRLVPTQIPLTLALTASVISLRGTAVVSKVAGYLETVAVRPGDLVLTDQVVAVVEHSQLDSQVLSAIAARRRADADLLNARAALSRAKAQLALAQANLIPGSGRLPD